MVEKEVVEGGERAEDGGFGGVRERGGVEEEQMVDKEAREEEE